MTSQAFISQAVSWLRTLVLVALLVLLAIACIKAFGVVIPVRGIDGLPLLYAAGVYWLTK